MRTMFNRLARSWIWRGVALLSLVLLSIGAASADNSAATITLFAPGAPTGAIAAVQFQSPSGEWFTVTGWQNPLTSLTKDEIPVPFEQWTVTKANFGQGPFRWVVYQPDGKTPWAISDLFNLPPGGGMDRSVTIRSDNLVTTAPTTTPTTTTAVQAAVSQAATVPVLKGGSAIMGVGCTGCESHAHITAYVSGLPVTTWFAVQWLDGLGQWQTVTGWQGTATFLYSKGDLNAWTPTGTGTLFLQWSVDPVNYGQGPFRWAAYDKQNGTLLAVSPNFNLPTMDGANSVMSLSD